MKQIVGVSPVNYTNKNGRKVKGIRLYILEPLPAPGIGDRTLEVYISNANIEDYPLGEIQTVLYEPTGYNNQFRCTGVIYA